MKMATAEVEPILDEPRVSATARRELEVNKLFRMVMKHEGSDLHLKVGLPPMMRLKGLIRQMEMKPLTQEDMERLMFPTLGERERQILMESGGIDYAYVVGQDEGRFRVNLFRQRGKLSLVARFVKNKIPNFEQLHLPSTIGRILDLFPADMHSAMRQALAFNLKAIICQKLLPSIKPGIGRVPTNEIMIMNPTVKDLLIKAEDQKLPDAIRIGYLEGML